MALGAKSVNELAGQLEDKVDQLFVVGDKGPRNIADAIFEGAIAAMRIFGLLRNLSIEDRVRKDFPQCRDRVSAVVPKLKLKHRKDQMASYSVI